MVDNYTFYPLILIWVLFIGGFEVERDLIIGIPWHRNTDRVCMLTTCI